MNDEWERVELLANRAVALAEACRFRSENLLVLAEGLLAELARIVEEDDNDNVSIFEGGDDGVDDEED